MKISKEAIFIIEDLVCKVNEVEKQLNNVITDPYEHEEIKNVIDAIKSRIGRFFMKNMDRRMIVRSDTSPLKDYSKYFEVAKKDTLSESKSE